MIHSVESNCMTSLVDYPLSILRHQSFVLQVQLKRLMSSLKINFYRFELIKL